MNKTAIKNFAISARKKLMLSVADKCLAIGIVPDGAREPDKRTSDAEIYLDAAGNPSFLSGKYIEARNKLLDHIRQLGNGDGFEKGYERLIEEVAYTWFNRIIAIRFMEVNDYLPTHTRVLSSETPGKFEPDIINQAFELDLGLSAEDKEYIQYNLKQNLPDFAFNLLFIRQCNALSPLLPGLFEPLADYTDLLISLPYTNPDGIIRSLLSIPEEDFDVSRGGQVEIIGWLYQYYNTELKDETYALLKQNVKITKERIPAATQLFTPDWIVRYMVENSLGRLWLEAERARAGMTEEYLNASYFGWKYYLEEAGQEEAVQKQLVHIRSEYKDLRPEELKVIDPCMGSGHILVYAFDLLMQIYQSCGYTVQDAAKLIAQNNLYGLDIDNRAYQLSYFALMMKGRQYDRRFLTPGAIKLNLASIRQSNGINQDMLSLLNGKAKGETTALLDAFVDAKTYGSILNMPDLDWDALEKAVKAVLDTSHTSIFDTIRQEHMRYELLPLIRQGRILADKYDVVVTNPPYMGGSGMNARLAQYVKDNYPDSKSDLFAVFIEKCVELLKPTGYQAMITQHAWMFLSSYEKLRGKLLQRDIVNMAHLGARAFEEVGGEVVQTTAFAMSARKTKGYTGTYARLVDFGSQYEKEVAFLSGKHRHTASADNFAKIPGSPVAYWVSSALAKSYEHGKPITEYVGTFQGIITGDNVKFLRQWSEVGANRIPFHKKSMTEIDLLEQYWIPYNKGGAFRKWYGIQDNVVFWKYGPDDKTRGRKGFAEYYLREYVAWSYTVSSSIATRFYPCGFLWDVRGSGLIDKTNNLFYLQSLISSKVGYELFRVKSDVLSCQVENIIDFPIIIDEKRRAEIEILTKNCIALSRTDWDSFETSWDFTRHPLICGERTISAAFANWEHDATDRFTTLKANEEELNRIFIEIYGLQDELTPEVEEKDVTVRRADLWRDIHSLISYAVGCMFGRYSLDVDGLAYAGGKWDETKYTTSLPDADNILPILDDEYFPDDIVGRFVEFIKTVYGEATLSENLAFIAAALGGKGAPLEVIRNYFLKDFYKDHVCIYQKRPIYWLFDSGKEDGFKALVYLHRYDSDTVGRIRTEYLHKTQTAIERAMLLCDAAVAEEKGKAIKRKDKLIRQLAETRAYDQALAHVALQRRELDLDDGVKVNYAKFQGVEVASEGKKTAKVDLLAGI